MMDKLRREESVSAPTAPKHGFSPEVWVCHRGDGQKNGCGRGKFKAPRFSHFHDKKSTMSSDSGQKPRLILSMKRRRRPFYRVSQ